MEVIKLYFRKIKIALRRLKIRTQPVLKLLMGVMQTIRAETSKEMKAKATPKGSDPDGLQVKLDKNTHKEIWIKHGYNVIAKNQDAP